MNTQLPVRMCLAGILCLLLQAAGKVVQEKDVLTISRPWLHEREFSENFALHATWNQTVVLRLEGVVSKGNPIVRNALRLMVDEAENLGSCIPAGDLHLVRLKLNRKGGLTLLNDRRGGTSELYRGRTNPPV